MKVLRIFLIAFTITLFSACSFRPSPTTGSEPETKSRVNIFELFGDYVSAYPPSNYTKISIATSHQNFPVVAFGSNLLGSVFIRSWNGSSWVSLANTLDKVSSHLTTSSSTAIGSNNYSVVFWSEFDLPGSDTYNVFVKRWMGTTWQSVSTGVADVELANNAYIPSMVLNAAN